LGYDTAVTRTRTLVVALAVALVFIGLVFVVTRLFPTRTPSTTDQTPVRHAASSSPDPEEPRRSRRRPQRPLVAPSAEVERTTGASIAGRVVDDVTGRGVANAALTFLHAGSALGANTASDGAFTLAGLEPGMYELYAIGAPGYAPFEADLGRAGITLRVEPDTRLRDVTFSLRAFFSAEGKVTDPGGAPVVGAEVHRLDGDATPWITDADGTFEVECSLGDVIEARHARFAPGRALCDRSARLGRPITLRLADAKTAAARESIAGRVVGADGRGIDGALVSVERRDGLRLPATTETASTADGSFSLEGLEAGSYDVSAAADGLAKSVARGVRSGEKNLVLRLETGGTLRGMVRQRETAQPVAGFSIVLWPVRGAFERGMPEVRTFFAPDGRFEIEALLPGDYVVTALSGGSPSAEERRVAISAGAVRDVVLDLTSGGRVFGVVHDAATGKPIAGALVALESMLGEERSAVPLLTSSASDEQGAFELRGVSAGRFTLAVSATNHHHKLSSGLTLRSGGELGPIRVDLEPTAPGEEPKLELQGIGAVLRPQGDAIIVAQVVPESGAARAGLAPGDRILAVDGQPVTSLGFQGTIEHIRGPEGTAVRLQIRRGDTESHLVAERRRMRR
jgi:hypothetical protein